MHPSPFLRKLVCPLAALVALSAPATLGAATLVDDQFADAGFTNGSDALDAAWSAVNTTLSVNTYNTSGNTSGGLINNVTSGFPMITGTFTNTTGLVVGESIRLQFDFRLTGPIANDGAGLRFGFGSSANVYSVTIGTGTASGFGIAQYSSTAVSGTSTGYTTTGSAISVNDTASHTFSLTVTRASATSLSFVASVDASTTTAVTSNSISNFTFSRIILGEGGTTNKFNIDNVLVTTSLIPEPSSIALLLGACALSTALLKRPKRRA